MNRKLIIIGILLANPAIGLIMLWMNALTVMSLTLLCANTIIIFALYTYSNRFVSQLSSNLQLSDHGLFNHKMIKSAQRLGLFVEDFRKVILSIHQIGQPEFAALLDRLQDESVKAPLKRTNSNIIDIRTKEQEHNWITAGIAKLSALKRSGEDVSFYCHNILHELINILNASQGAIFLVHDNDGDEAYLELQASYAYDSAQNLSRRIQAGDGLIGQAYYEKEIVYLTNIPKDYIKITSGLGEALPNSICILPLVLEGKVHGIVEIASFKNLQPFEIQFLQKSAEGIAYNLHSIHTHTHTTKLLKESQRMAEEVSKQEEELRQRMIDLTSTQEQMKRKQVEMDTVLASLSTVELDIDGFIIDANAVFQGITGHSLENIRGREYKSLIPQQGNDPVQYEIMWSSIMRGRSFTGEFRIVNSAKKEMWMAGSFTPILNQMGSPHKVMVISLFTTQDKEKLVELQETIAALKHCFPIAELNGDLTFKSANDLFLTELGVRRIDLKNLQPRNVLANGSFGKIEKFFANHSQHPDHIELEIQHPDGVRKKFQSTLVTVNSTQRKKGLVILRNPI